MSQRFLQGISGPEVGNKLVQPDADYSNQSNIYPVYCPGDFLDVRIGVPSKRTEGRWREDATVGAHRLCMESL